MHPIVLFIIQAGAVAAALLGIGSFIEKYWSPVKRWLQDALTTPVIAKMDEIKQDMRERDDVLQTQLDDLADSFEEHRKYVFGHLGPNGKTDTPPLHERVGHLEDAVENLREKE